MISWWQAGSSGALGWEDFMLKEHEWVCWWTVVSSQAAHVWSQVISILCVTNNIESLEFYGRCSLPSTASKRIDFTHSTSQTFLELQEIAVPVPLLTHLKTWHSLAAKSSLHCWELIHLSKVVEVLPARWEWTVPVAPEFIQKGEKVRRGTLGSEEERFGDCSFVTETKPGSSALGPELKRWFGDLSSRLSSFPCSAWQVWFILCRPLFLHLQSEQSLNWYTLNLNIL